LWWVGYSFCPVAAKNGDAKFYFLLGAVNQYPYADYYATLPGHCCHNLAYGVAGGEDIVNNKGSLDGVDSEAPPKSPFLSSFLLSKYASYPQLSGYFKSQDNTTSGWSGYNLNFLLPEVVGNHLAELLGIVWELQDFKLLPVDRGM
jgi:hypothetical protein